ncbi:MAG: hypothetical protein NWE77_01835, partial [Candidatus Bathyarchaeota archaeon]|nr:hypothetical protein [Candidatus Bathyarchaeota archaeon]
MRRASLTLTLTTLLVSLFLLSVLSNTLTGYPEHPQQRDAQKRPVSRYSEEESPVLLFKVSPAMPQLFWRTLSADYYTGLNWFRTTDEKVLEEFPQIQQVNATEVFTVEINRTQPEIFLPLPSPNSILANGSFASFEDLKLYVDTIGNVSKIVRVGQALKAPLVYEVPWRDVQPDDRIALGNNVSEVILNKYLQLPDIQAEVWNLAKDLENPSYTTLDQVLADVQFLRVNFVYDINPAKYPGGDFAADTNSSGHMYERISQGSDVSSFLERKRGVCIDAATALAVILRIQKIPARISVGYKPERIEDGKLLYYSTGAHAVTEVYLPPYGWIQFDATPPLEENPLVRVSPFKKEASSGSKLLFQLSITNRHNLTDLFKLIVHSKQEWNIEAAPERLKIENHQDAYALLEVTIPHDADVGEKDVVTITVASIGRRNVAFSISAIIQVENIFHIPTATLLGDIDESVTRGDTFWVNGTIHAANDEQIDDMAILVFLTQTAEADGVVIGKGRCRQGIFRIESMVPYFMEIGDYNVIPISLGTSRHAPSRSDSIIRVRSKTSIELDSEDELLIGYGAIHGRLLWDNGTGFANTSIMLRIASLATPKEVWKLQNRTFKDGSFRIETAFENPGTYNISAMFSGDGYILGSNATQIVKLEHELPEIQIFSENTAVRGEVFNISGTIQFEDIGVWGEPVTLNFDNQVLGTIETRDNGSYTYPFLVDSEEQLGSHIISVTLEKGNLSTFQKIAVKSRTTMTTKVSKVAGGMLLLFAASLCDDHNLPISGADIVIDNYGLSAKTDRNGNLSFLLDTVKLWPENSVLNARFEGSELYLPEITEKEIALEPMATLLFLLPLVSPTLIILAFAHVKKYRKRRQALRQITDMEIGGARAATEEEFINVPQEVETLRLVLPDIDAMFPKVWGVKEKLRIEIVLDKSVLEKTEKNEVEFFIDEEAIASVGLSLQGHAELSHVFASKGEHKMRALIPKTSRHRPWNAETKIRVVDYGEEIIRLYNEFLGKLASYGMYVRNEMTAREIERRMLNTGDFDSETLREVTTCFEKAEYSNHLTARKDYEIMYHSLKKLNVDV